MIRIQIQRDLASNPLGLSLNVTSSRRPSLTTLPLFYSPNSIYHSLNDLVIDLFASLPTSPRMSTLRSGIVFTDVSSVLRIMSGTQ